MRKIAEPTIRRLSLYLRFLEEFEGRGTLTVSSEELAHRGATTAAQVRKDLSLFGSFGKRGLGYPVPQLAARLRDILGLERDYGVAVIGAGKVGRALAQYGGFASRGFRVRWVYDAHPAKVGMAWDGLRVRDVRLIRDDFPGGAPDIAIVATPADAAQDVADQLVGLGVKAILNFAPVHLAVPHDVTVKNVNMAIELEALSYALRHR
ncbi:MAG TPA: redox-sensing transcriptional repressor Rex [Gemmatimonadales bacterium]|jgi:redox-sensing transcriptional repressor